MRAAFIERYGGPDLLKYGDLPDPEAESGEVVIDVHAASVNAADWKVRAGQYAQATFPLILGRDFSGVISTVGAGVADLKRGDAVFGVCESGQEGPMPKRSRSRRLSSQRSLTASHTSMPLLWHLPVSRR